MGVVGPFVAYGIYRGLKGLGAPLALSIFMAATLGNIMTYITTAIQLGLAFPAATGGVMTSIAKFLGIFAFTQIPLAISEGLLTVMVFNILNAYSQKDLQVLTAFTGKTLSSIKREVQT